MGVALQDSKQDPVSVKGGFAYVKRMFPETQDNTDGACLRQRKAFYWNCHVPGA